MLLLDVRMIDSSGIGTYLQNLIPYLKDKIDIAFLGDKEKIEKVLDIKDAKVIPIKSPIYFPLEQIEYLLKIRNCKIFWSPHFNAPIFPIRAEKRIVTVHDVFHLAFSHLYNPIEGFYAKFLIKNACVRSDLIITVSNFSKSEIIKYLDIEEKKIKVIYNGVNHRLFKIYSKNELEEFKRNLNLPERFLLYVGNVKPHKNLRSLIFAFESLMEKEKDLYLIIVGRKEGFIKGDELLEEKLYKREKLREKIIFTGYIEKKNLPLIYNLATLFVFPSLYEGFGLPPLEAMACGCPVIASNIPPFREVLKDAAFYVDPYDVESIKEGILIVLNDSKLREYLAAKGLDLVKNYSWEKSAQEHIEIIKQLL